MHKEHMMGFEPTTPPWKGGVLAADTTHAFEMKEFLKGSACFPYIRSSLLIKLLFGITASSSYRNRTCNLRVKFSRLNHLTNEPYFITSLKGAHKVW